MTVQRADLMPTPIAVLTSIDEQSADIALGVDQAYESRQEGATEDFGTGAGG